MTEGVLRSPAQPLGTPSVSLRLTAPSEREPLEAVFGGRLWTLSMVPGSLVPSPCIPVPSPRNFRPPRIRAGFPGGNEALHEESPCHRQSRRGTETEFDGEFRQWILDFPLDQLPRIYAALASCRENQDVFLFKSRQEAQDWTP